LVNYFKMSKIRQVFILGAIGGTILGFLALQAYRVFVPIHPTAPTGATAPSPEQAVLAEVAARVALPAGRPTMTQIHGVEALRRQNPAFYALAENGDWIIRYPAQVVLYRAASGTVVAVVPITPTP
jgi:hypothetical protein